MIQLCPDCDEYLKHFPGYFQCTNCYAMYDEDVYLEWLQDTLGVKPKKEDSHK